jgi:hypothetical protein
VIFYLSGATCRILQRGYEPHFIRSVAKNPRLLPNWARQIVLDCCMHDYKKKYNLSVSIAMPNHVHIILTPLTDEVRRIIFPLPEIMKAIKASHRIRLIAGLARVKLLGRKNRSITCCGRLRVWTQRLITFCRIPCAKVSECRERVFVVVAQAD